MRTPDLNQMIVFSRVVELGSFTRAARDLELPKATVSRRVAELEARLGTRLLQRTTRRLSLTEAGAAYAEHCSRISAEIEAAESTVGRMRAVPVGALRVALPFGFGSSHVTPLIARFVEQYPQVRLDLTLTNQKEDLVEKGFDVVIRIGPSEDVNFPGHRLGSSPVHLYASPRYLVDAPRLSTPADLGHHRTITMVRWQAGSYFAWQLERGAKHVRVQLIPTLVCNSATVLTGAALSGTGIMLLAEFFVRPYVAEGSLVRVLPGWSAAPVEFIALYPSRHGVPPKVRAFLDFLGRNLTLGPVSTT